MAVTEFNMEEPEFDLCLGIPGSKGQGLAFLPISHTIGRRQLPLIGTKFILLFSKGETRGYDQ